MSTTTSECHHGLLTAQGVPVPLAAVRIDADITGFCARVQVTQRYKNEESGPIEAVYAFPLDDGAAVCGFEAVIDGVRHVGEVQERDDAFAAYDDALRVGHGAFLLDQEQADVFTASVGNLAPGAEVQLQLTYVTEIRADGDDLRFTLPTTLSPRYAPSDDRAGGAQSAAARLNPPLAWPVPYGLTLEVRVAFPRTGARIESPSHPIAIAWQQDAATITLSQADAALDRDFVLLVGAAAVREPRAWIEQDDDGRETVAVGFCPELREPLSPSEVIFLVDCSGSMGGNSIDEVRKALHLCLRSITPGSSFNLIAFGSDFSALFAASRRYDDASLAAASRWVDALDANKGGTEILPALRFALESARLTSLARQVVVLTDGHVTNTEALLALAGRHAAHARIFTFGIGAGAGHALVRGLARISGGAAEFIAPRERLAPKVLRQFRRVASAGLSDLRIDWGEASVTAVPSTPMSVADGARVMVYGFVEGRRPSRVRLTARSASGPYTVDLSLDTAVVTRGRTIATLAARARIQELEDVASEAHDRGSRQERQPREVRAIVALARQYGLMSRHTSYVAVERRETPVPGGMQLRRVPVALTSEWGGLQRSTAFAAPAPMMSALAAPASSGRFADLLSWSGVRRHASPGPAAPRPRTGIHGVITLQRADGSWSLTRELAAALRFAFKTLDAAGQARGGEPLDAWATAVAVAWLETHASASEDEWRLVAQKARAWLEAEIGPQPSQAVIDAARQFVAGARVH